MALNSHRNDFKVIRSNLGMIWPGMGDPRKRKKTLRFLAITAIIAIGVGAASSLIQAQLSLDDPLKVCINNIINKS